MLSDFSFSDTTVGFLIEGNFNSETVDTFIEKIKTKLEQFDAINLYIEDTGIETFSIPAVLKEVLFKIKYADQFNKIAVVSDRKWIHSCGDIVSLFANSNTRNFTSEERMDAITWIAEH
ncbi:SpoIIAA family protein [Marixanthomonas ophiurae]|uniref:STAS/SEC14 domain-containing protein n=1 Tax=Marixanthomonas ophiurae TaxID=387659 RepID=A0A3E1QC21_9FLAO|nr:STAS/SEC14 domain-containing protein [Marixanthomonas ophiurae]RFN59695.1 STAS/SEC14 domain-containing protein [Marixanthomonas ophiurae]